MAHKADPERERRLAEALRQNLRRRKAQNARRAEPADEAPDAAPSSPKGEATRGDEG